jgi:nucleoside-diphosphate-sugar epimerase
MRILVTGANGFLARALQPLLPPAWETVALTHASAASDAFRRRYQDLAPLLAHEPGFDGIFHLAAQIRAPTSGPSGYLPANVELPSALVRAYPDARHVLASSTSVYGDDAPLPIGIGTPCRPEHPYGQSKLAGEQAVRNARSHAVVRFSSLLGPDMHRSTFVPRIIDDARTRGIITLLGSGERTQNYLDVRDAAQMCLRALQSPASFVTLGIGRGEWSNNAVAGLVAARTGARIVHEGSDSSPSRAYTQAGGIDLGENVRPLDVTLDWLIKP